MVVQDTKVGVAFIVTEVHTSQLHDPSSGQRGVNLLVESTCPWTGQELVQKEEGRHFVLDIVIEIDYRQTVVSRVIWVALEVTAEITYCTRHC